MQKWGNYAKYPVAGLTRLFSPGEQSAARVRGGTGVVTRAGEGREPKERDYGRKENRKGGGEEGGGEYGTDVRGVVFARSGLLGAKP